MIELNKTYKLKKLRNVPFKNSEEDFMVIAFYNDNTVICKPMNSDSNEAFLFLTKCLIDPEKPDEIYFN